MSPRSLLFAVAVASSLDAAWAEAPGPGEQAKVHLEEIRQLRSTPGISAAVAVGGSIAWSRGVGMADLENAVPATPATVYNIGSISKGLTAVAVLQLVEQGKVGLDDPVQRFVPSFPDKGRTITVRHLLTHRSGIRHYREVEFPGTPGDENVKPYASLAEAIALFKDDPLLYAPGERSSYSSFAVNLLQGVIETASGLPFEEYMKRHVWGPAAMSSTGFDVPERIVAHRARSYRLVDGRTINAPYGDLTYKFASGGMISTAEDLVRLCVHLNSGTLLQRATIDLMYDARMDPVPGYPDKPPAKGPVAFLWDVDTDEQGRLVVSRDGGVKGFRGCVVNYPREDVAAAVLYNSTAGPPTCRAARELAHFFLTAPSLRSAAPAPD